MKPSGLERFKSRSGSGASPPIETIEFPQPDRRSKSKRFEQEWIKLPMHWVKALHRAKANGTTYGLAHTILAEFYKRRRFGVTEVILSTETTSMKRNTKLKAAKTLARLELITLIPEGKQALRAIPHITVRRKESIEKDLCSRS
jgi:hypothetical protein